MDNVPECKSLINEVVKGVGSELLGLLLKGILMGFVCYLKDLAISGGVISSGLPRPQLSKYQNTENRRYC